MYGEVQLEVVGLVVMRQPSEMLVFEGDPDAQYGFATQLPPLNVLPVGQDLWVVAVQLVPLSVPLVHRGTPKQLVPLCVVPLGQALAIDWTIEQEKPLRV